MSVNVFGKQGTKTFELKSAHVSMYRLHVLDMDTCCHYGVQLKGMQCA